MPNILKREKQLTVIHMLVEGLIMDRAPKDQPNLMGVDVRWVEVDVLDALRRGPAWVTLLSQTGPSRNYGLMNRRNIFSAAQIEIAWAPTSSAPSRGPRSTSRCLVHSARAIVRAAAGTSST